MPEEFGYEIEIDTTAQFIRCRGWGVLSPWAIESFRQELRAHPDFDPTMRQLVDLSGVSAVSVPGRLVRTFVRDDPFGPEARRALVARKDAVYGVLRMYEAHGAEANPKLGVFRTIPEAERWLEVGGHERGDEADAGVG